MERKHFYEIDFLRSFTMLGVIAVHTMTIYNNQLTDGTRSFLVMSAVHSSIHVMRMIFMFITGFVLVASNLNREFKVVAFWRKRLFYVIIPYLFWNIVYILFRSLYSLNLHGSIGLFMKELAKSLIHGDQFYIYYVLVTLQFYFVFPLMFWLLKKFEKYHGYIFACSFAFQLILMTYYKFVSPQINTSDWPYLLSHYGVFVLSYQCYFIIGGIVAWHYKEILAFISKHHRFIMYSLGFYVVLMWIHYYFDRRFLHESDSRAQMVHQPVYLPYTILVIAVMLFLGNLWDKHRADNQWKLFSRYIKIAAKTSFGIYLVQPFPLYIMRNIIMPYLPDNKWLCFATLPLGILFVYFTSMLIAYVFHITPILSYCVGVKSKWPRRAKSPAAGN